MSSFDWDRYCGTRRREVARRPTAVLVAEAEAKALEAMGWATHAPSGVKFPLLTKWRQSVRASEAAETAEESRHPLIAGPAVDLAMGSPPPPRFTLPTATIGSAVICLNADIDTRFGMNGTVDAYESRWLIVDFGGSNGYGNYPESAWCRSVFPLDAKTLRPRVGMHVAMATDDRGTFVGDPKGAMFGTINRVSVVDGSGGGPLDEDPNLIFAFVEQHWLRRIWPDRLRGNR